MVVGGTPCARNIVPVQSVEAHERTNFRIIVVSDKTHFDAGFHVRTGTRVRQGSV